MKVYLDNNIIVSIENGDFTFEELNSILPNKENDYYFSSAHIFEVESFKGNASTKRSELLTRRFSTIRDITRNNYLYIDLSDNKVLHIIEDPQDVYDTITESSFGIGSIKGMVDLIPSESKKVLREQLEIDSTRLNNYSSKEIIKHLNTKLTLFNNLSFIEIIEYSVHLHPQGKSFGLHNRYAAIFEFLDLLGYWKDKETGISNYARLWDSLHTFFSSYCDYYISNDKRTRNKAKVVFEIYGIETKILSFN